MFQPNKRYSSDEEIDIITDDDNDSFPDESGNETDITTDYSNDDTDDDASLFDDEERHPPEYYLHEAANLDVQRLRQERYGPKTKDRLDWVKEHCIQ